MYLIHLNKLNGQFMLMNIFMKKKKKNTNWTRKIRSSYDGSKENKKVQKFLSSDAKRTKHRWRLHFVVLSSYAHNELNHANQGQNEENCCKSHIIWYIRC